MDRMDRNYCSQYQYPLVLCVCSSATVCPCFLLGQDIVFIWSSTVKIWY